MGSANNKNEHDQIGQILEAPKGKPAADKFFYCYPSFSDDGRFMPVTWIYNKAPAQPKLTDADIKELAAKYGVPYCHIKAVLAVESAGSGFLLHEPHPARPKILFEGHKFHIHSGSVPVSKNRPDLSYKKWTKKYYLGGSAEWKRLEDAMKFHEIGALMSTSFGAFQILGSNYKEAGCTRIQQFVEENFESEKNHLRHMLNFCEACNILDALRKGDWDVFAHAYNGEAYRKNQYDARLAEAVKKCK